MLPYYCANTMFTYMHAIDLAGLSGHDRKINIPCRMSNKHNVENSYISSKKVPTPAKILSPFLTTAPLQYVPKILFTQATTDKTKNALHKTYWRGTVHQKER